MATSLIKQIPKPKIEDLTSEITWNSTVLNKEAYLIHGDMVFLRVTAQRTSSTSDWTLATIPDKYCPSNTSFSVNGVGFQSNQTAVSFRLTYINNAWTLNITNGSSVNLTWIQGTIFWPIV